MLISDFARLGQVSVRMLRHYDAIGLLVPAEVDRWNGYRTYTPEQLPVLNRLVALKELGFTLDQVRHLLHDDLPEKELRDMLQLRLEQLKDEHRAVGTRLAAVEARLRMIEMEDHMSADYVVKTLSAGRLVCRTATLDPARLGEFVGPMFGEVSRELGRFPGALVTPIATYAESEAGMDVAVGYVWDGEVPDGLEVVSLPEARGVCGVHLGEMTGISASWQALEKWVVENGYEMAGPCRELYVKAEGDDQSDWVTELQQPVAEG